MKYVSMFVQTCLYKLKNEIFLLPVGLPTRWGSMSKMVSRILEQKEPIRLVLSSDRITSHLVPT